MAFVKTNLPCPQLNCTSSDAYSIDEKGNGWCFSCDKGTWNDDSSKENVLKYTKDKKIDHEAMMKEIPTYQSVAMPERGLTLETAEKFGVKAECNESTGLPDKYFFPYYKNGALVGYKGRNVKDKNFFAVGDISGADLFGSKNVSDKGQMIVVTEGEMDALAASQMLADQGKGFYKVVSLPNGAKSKLENHMEFLGNFDNIMLNFDNDKHGQDAVERAQELFDIGSVRVIEMPQGVKDANDMILQGRKPAEYLRMINNAKTYRPDGIVNLADTFDLMFESDSEKSVPYPWDGLNDKLYGIRPREIVTITSGAGMGKSAVTRELTHWLFNQTTDNIGVLPLEESVQRTSWGIVSIEANLPLAIREERAGVPREDIRKWYDATIGTGRIFTLDHFGSTSEANLINRIKYMIKGLGCKWVILDHLSIVVSSQEEGGDERKNIDSIMTKLRSLVEETGAGLILVSHLRRVSGDKGHEQGHEVSLTHLRGSQSIAQLSDCVIGLERDQQADQEKAANLTRVRVLKNRYAGLTGLACSLYYDRATGRLQEINNVEEFLGKAEGDY